MKPIIKYQAINSIVSKYTVLAMCRFFGVSRSGYYTWLKRSKKDDKDKVIGKMMQECQQHTKFTYGYRRMKVWLLREPGLLINYKTVLRIMRKYNLQAQIRRPRTLYLRQQ